MCLGPEFFDQRDETTRTREAAGEIEVEHFMRTRRLRFGLLLELGYLEDSQESPNTADLFSYQVPLASESYFSEDSDLQLIFVRPESARTLTSRLRNNLQVMDPNRL